MTESVTATSQNNSSYSNNSCSDAGVSMFDQTSTITDPLQSILLPRQLLNSLPYFLTCVTRILVVSALYYYQGPQDVAALFAMQIYFQLTFKLAANCFASGAVAKTMVLFQKQRRAEGNTVLLYTFIIYYVLALIILLISVFFMKRFYAFVVTFSGQYQSYFSISIYVQSFLYAMAYSTDFLLVLDNNAGMRILLAGINFLAVSIFVQLKAFNKVDQFTILVFAESVITGCFAVIWFVRFFAIKRKMFHYRSAIRVKFEMLLPIRWGLFFTCFKQIAVAFIDQLFIPMAGCFVVYFAQRDVNAHYVQLNLLTVGFVQIFWDLSFCLCDGWIYYTKAVLNNNKTMDRYDRIWMMLTRYFLYFVCYNCVYTAAIHVLTKPILSAILGGDKAFTAAFIEYAFEIIRPVSLLAFFAPPMYLAYAFAFVLAEAWWIVLPLRIVKYAVFFAFILIQFLTTAHNAIYAWIVFYPQMACIIASYFALPLVYKKLIALRKSKQENVQLADLGALKVEEVQIDTLSEINVEIKDFNEQKKTGKFDSGYNVNQGAQSIMLAKQQSAIRFSTSAISQQKSQLAQDGDACAAEQDKILQFLAKE